jgi:triacylglycerol lipase
MDEDFNIRKEIISKIKELGRVMNDNLTDAMIRLYAPLLNRAPREGVSLTRDESYGPHSRHRLDIYVPGKEPSGSTPVLVFFHGGGFTEGDKDLYRNIGYYFARHGITTLIPSYRLAPEHKWPSGAEDVAKVLEWIKANGSKLNGGDTKGAFRRGVPCLDIHLL